MSLPNTSFFYAFPAFFCGQSPSLFFALFTPSAGKPLPSPSFYVFYAIFVVNS